MTESSTCDFTGIKEDLFNLDTYNYFLPKELIAQYPIERRDNSKLLCYEKQTGIIIHRVFHELAELLNGGDILVLNNTKVIPARFRAASKEIEILLVSSVSPDNLTWKVLAKPKKQLNKAKSLILNPEITIEVINNETIRFKSHDDLEYVLNNIGVMPLPPYIKRSKEVRKQGGKEKGFSDFERYQTVYAKETGAVAAPTAGLHFTSELLRGLEEKGVEILYITLHVGPGTFLPIRENDIRKHTLIPEGFYIEQEVWNKILEAKKNKKRIIACGTTTVRALEYAYMINKLSGLNSLYITPGFEFKVVDSLITNFHLPKTTLLVLVSAFANWESVKKIYQEAIKEKYRFYSYGDAMFIY